MSASHDFWGKLDDRFGREIDAASVGWVRLVCAMTLLWRITAALISSEIYDRYINPVFYFKYPFFPFVTQMPGYVPYGVFVLVAVFGIALLAGWKTSWTSKVLAVLWTLIFLQDASMYSDHQYLVLLLVWLMAWLPVNRWMSSDRYTGREKRSTVPWWCVWILRFQVSLILVVSGCNKLNGDWLAGSPLAEWVTILGSKWPIPQSILGMRQIYPVLAGAMAAFEILAGVALWWRAGAMVFVPLLLVYYFIDTITLETGVSPLMGLLAIVFLPPSFPRLVADRFAPLIRWIPGGKAVWGILCRLGRIVDGIVGWFDETPVVGTKMDLPTFEPEESHSRRDLWKVSEWTKYGLAVWILFQVILPLRWMAFAKAKDWGEFSSRFSWRGQIQDKQGRATITMTLLKQELKWTIDPTGEFPVPMAFLYTQPELQRRGLNEGLLRDIARTGAETLQKRIEGLNFSNEEMDRLADANAALFGLQLSPGHMEIMVRHPEFIRQYARQVAMTVAELSGDQVQVHALVEESVNFRPYQVCVPQTVDLSALTGASDLWDSIQPMKEPLPSYDERIADARELRDQREMELELQQRTMGLRRPPEPKKSPAISDEADAQLQAEFSELSTN